MIIKDSNFRWWLSIIFTYVTVGIVYGIYLIPLQFKYTQKTPPFYSRNSTKPFNRSEEPIFVLHYSDVHVNHVAESNNQIFRSAVEYSKKVKPSMNILTGDLVDDFPYNDYPKYGSQQPKDWEIYRNITSGIDKDVWFEIAGNHDEFGVFSFDSDGHNFRKSIKTNLSDISQFHLQERIVPTNGGYNIHIIGVNPFVYPSAHPPFVYWPRPSRETMDKLEEIIEKVPEGDEVIVMDHYPLKLFPPHKRTSSGKNFQELMTTGKVHYFLSGHLHPAKPKLMHFPNLLEVVAVDSKSHNYIGCFTYDNHRFVYHQVNITRPPYAYVTNPVPTSQLTNHQIFNEVGTPVRVLSMHSKMPKITVSGDLNGEMTCKKLNSGHFLCELENNLKQGQYSISLNGSITKTVNFTIGEKSDWYLEAEYKDVNNERYIFQTILLFIVILFFIFPLPKSKFAEEFLDILNGVQTEISTTKLIIIILFGWILSIRFRIQKLSFWIKGLLLVALLWPLVLPAIFLEIEGHKGFIWMWGYECGGKFYYAIWGQRNCLHYYLYVLAPACVLAASLSMTYKFSFSSFIPVLPDIALCILCIVKNAKLVIRYVYESVGFTYAPSAPIHVIWPIVLYLSLIVYRCILALKREIVSIDLKDSLLSAT